MRVGKHDFQNSLGEKSTIHGKVLYDADLAKFDDGETELW